MRRGLVTMEPLLDAPEAPQLHTPFERLRTSAVAWVDRHGLTLGLSAISAVAAAFLVHQLMAWPPHEDEALALLVARHSFVDVLEHVTRERGGAPLHFAAAWAIAAAGGGLGSLRYLSLLPSLATLPLVGLLGARLVDRRTALLGTALFATSWVFLLHAVYGRMYGLFLLFSIASTLALLRALDKGDRRSWAFWIVATLLNVATHPYGILVLGGHVLTVLLGHRSRLRSAAAALAVVVIAGIPFWITDLVLAGRFDVSVGDGRGQLSGPAAVARYLWAAAGDASAGWWPVTALVVGLATLGFVRVPRPAKTLFAAMLAAPVGAFLLSSMGGSAAPESRHLIFLAPLFSLAVATGIWRLARHRRRLATVVAVCLLTANVAWAWHRAAPLFEWEPDQRQVARSEAESWLAETGRPTDIVFGYDPLYLGAWERNHAFTDAIVPRADARLALRVVRRHAPLGRGVWVFDASDVTNHAPRLEIEQRVPTPTRLFESTAFGPFLIVRTRYPIGSPATYLARAARAMVLGRSLQIADVGINMATVERANREHRGYGASRWLAWSPGR